MTDEPDSGDALSRSELRHHTLAGIRWVTLARISSELLALVSSVILARLISPAEFGRAAIALIMIKVVGSIMSAGIGAAIVQMPEARRHDLQSATLLALSSGVILAAAGVALGLFLVPDLLGERTGDLVALCSLGFLLVPVGTVSNAVLQRKLDFRRLGLIDVASVVIGTITSVALAAAADLGGVALVVGVLAATATAAVLYVASVPFIRPGFDRGSTRAILNFGVPSGLAALFYAVFRRIDYVILGARLSAAQVGYYWRAYQLGVEYQSKVTMIMLKLAFPVFSRTKNLEDMRAVRVRVVRLHASVVIPPLATFIAIAPVLVPWLYGETWEPTVVPAQILAVVGMGAAVATGTGALLMAAGKAKLVMTNNLINLVAYAVAVWLAAPAGLTVVSLTVLGVQTVRFIWVQYFVLQRVIGITPQQIRQEAAPGTCASLALLAVTYPLVDRLSAAGVDAVWVLLLSVPLAAAIAIGILWRFFPTAWADIAMIARLVLPRMRQAGAAR